MNTIELIKKATIAQGNSQSKYSKFPVGCAILTKDDSIVLGLRLIPMP